MKKTTFRSAISLILLFSVVATGGTGFVQSRLELRNFTPHIYAGYLTLIFTLIHVLVNFNKILTFWGFKGKRKTEQES